MSGPRASWLVLGLALASSAPLAGARLTVSSASAPAGTSATLSLAYAAEGAHVAILQVELLVSAPLVFSSARAGAAATAAGKQVTGSPITGGVRLLVYGLNQNVLGDGVLAEISLSVPSGTAEGTYAVTPASVGGADPGGASIAVTAVPGAVTVGSGGGWLLPSSARVSGAGGTFWTTDLTLVNTGTSTATATVKFLGHTGDGRNGPERTVSLQPGETKSYADVLSLLFGLGSDYGPILTRSTASLAVAGQTWTPGGGGTFGQSVPAATADEWIGSSPRTIAGVTENASFRTNLMMANAGESPVDVDVALVAAGGSTLATKRVTVGPLSMAQLNVGIDLGQTNVSGASLVLSAATPGGRFAAYASAIDKKTGDPRTLLPAAASGAGPWLLPSSARISGAGGTFWVTDLTIRNMGTAAATATVKFLGHSGDGRNGPERAVSLLAGETKSWADVLGTLFGLGSDYGPLLVTSTAALAVAGQTWTPGGGGTYGQSVPAATSGEWIGSSPRTIAGVTENASFRTNLMIANAAASPADVDVVLVSAWGSTLATTRVTVGPMSLSQLGVGSDLGQTNVSGASLVLSTPTSGASVAAYASAIDRRTGDPRTLLPQ